MFVRIQESWRSEVFNLTFVYKCFSENKVLSINPVMSWLLYQFIDNMSNMFGVLNSGEVRTHKMHKNTWRISIHTRKHERRGMTYHSVFPWRRRYEIATGQICKQPGVICFVKTAHDFLLLVTGWFIPVLDKCFSQPSFTFASSLWFPTKMLTL
jgi:hypothetical protein